MITKAEWVKRFIEIGISLEHALIAADEIEAEMSGATVDKKALARRKRNQRHYQKKKALKNESVLKGLNERLKTSENVLNVLNGKYVVKQGTPQGDAWHGYYRQTKGTGLPYSKHLDGWEVPSEWPPNYRAA